MMKRLLPGALALFLLLTLCACDQSVAETTPTPMQEPTPSATTSLSPEPTPEPTPTPEASIPPVVDDSTRYFFFQCSLLGSWADGQWHSAAEESFTVGELFNRTYYDFWGDPLGAARIYVGDGPGSFDAPDVVAPLLEPYGIIEGDDLIMKLPGQFTGEAAALTVPHYSFAVSFDGQPHLLASNVPMTRPDMRLTTLDLPLETVIQALESVGIHYKNPTRANCIAWLCDMDGDGQDEYLELIQTPYDESYYAILEPGDPIFYAFLFQDGEEVSVISSQFFPYTDDLTAQFRADSPYFYDLDGNGVCELLFQVGAWEGGCDNAFSLVDGVWTLVLQSNYGT